MTNKLFKEREWPTAEAVAPLVKGDRAFLILYRLYYNRHVLSTLNTAARPASFAQYIEAWNAYREFFAFVMEGEGEGGVAVSQLPPVWMYDTFSDLAYLYEKYGELHTGGPAAAPRGGSTDEDIAAAWRLPDLLAHLHATVERTGIVAALTAPGASNPAGFRPLAGYFALGCLLRLYTKLGDYGAALEAARPLRIFATDGTVFGRIPKALVTTQYYASFALVMARRFEDAFRVMNRTLSQFQRMHGVFSEGAASSYRSTHLIKMLAMLAITVAVLPGVATSLAGGGGGGGVDESIRKPLRDKHERDIERVARGGEGAAEVVDRIINDAAPGTLTWSSAEDGEAARASLAYHISLLQADVAARVGGAARLRSLLRLYTSIEVPKLAEAAGMTADEVRCVAPASCRICVLLYTIACCACVLSSERAALAPLSPPPLPLPFSSAPLCLCSVLQRCTAFLQDQELDCRLSCCSSCRRRRCRCCAVRRR